MVYLGRLIIYSSMNPVRLVAAGLAGCIGSPAFHIPLGLIFLNQSARPQLVLQERGANRPLTTDGRR
jgi:hypothetical protein